MLGNYGLGYGGLLRSKATLEMEIRVMQECLRSALSDVVQTCEDGWDVGVREG